MKKILITLAASAIFALANNNTTVNATMSLMNQGMEKIQKGFLLNQKDMILEGISMTQSANSIFKTVDVKTFIAHNNKVQVTKNINANVDRDLEVLKKDVQKGHFANATAAYGKVMRDCISCHTIIRGW